LTVEESLWKIAGNMKLMDRHSEHFQLEQYYRLAFTHFENLKQQQEMNGYLLSEEGLLRVLEKQLAELVRMGRANKLMQKVDHL
jgi:hypothetical protein